MDLVKTVLAACVHDVQVPETFLDKVAMQKFLESLSVAEERERVMTHEREEAVGEEGLNLELFIDA